MRYGIFTFGKIYGSIQANSTMFYLRKIPILGSLIQQNIYKYKVPKYLFGVLGTVIDIILKAIGVNFGIYIFLSFIPSMLAKLVNTPNWPDQSTMIFIFIASTCIPPPIMKGDVFVSNAEDHTFLNHFMINPTRYYHYKIVKNFIIDGLLIAPILIYLFRDATIVCSLILFKMFFNVSGNVIFLEINNKKPEILVSRIKWIVVGLLLMITIYVISMTKVFNGITIPLALSIIISVCVTIGIILCFLYLFKFKEYKQVAVQYVNQDTVTLKVSGGSTIKSEGLAGFKTVDWKENRTFFDANKHLGAWKYIHKAFQTRLKKAMQSFYKSQVFLNLFILVAIGLLIRFSILTVDTSNILKYSPILLSFVMNACYGKTYMQICFRYMDMPMLYNHMYDTNKIVSSMTSRCLLLLRKGIISIIFLIIGIVSLLLITGIQISTLDFIKLCVSYTLIFIIYEMYNVIVYYLLQPYSVDLNAKNPIFKVLSYIEGLFFASVLIVRNNVTEIIPALLISLGVIIVLFIISSKLAHKTFKLRY